MWSDITQVWNVINDGDPMFEVPQYNGGLFANDSEHPIGELLERIKLTNETVGVVLTALLTHEETSDGGVGVVDFRSLSVREFGTI